MKKKVLALFLCLTMLLCTVALFASCGGSEDPTDPGTPPAGGGVELDPVVQSSKTVTVDLSGADGLQYKIIRCGTYTDVLKQDAVGLSGVIMDKTKAVVRIGDDNGSSSNGDYEILLGFGFRDVCNHALSEIEGDGWIIRTFADEGKIVIAGTTEFLTGMAIDYFMENCLVDSKLSGSKLTISESIVCENMEMVEIVGLAEDGTTYEGKYNVVYRKGLDDVKGNIYSDQYTNDYDKPYEIATAIKSLLVSKTRIGQYTVAYKYDTDDVDDSGKGEILVGVLERPEAKQANALLTPNQYSLTIQNNRIILGALNDTMLLNAQLMFNNMIEQSLLTDEAGARYIKVPAKYYKVETDTKREQFAIDFPKPDGLLLQETVDVGTDSMLFVYTGDGVSREGYVAYCDKLEADGYEVISAEYQTEGSSFRTYINRKEGITLHVSHEAHTHATEQKVTGFVNSIRVVSAYTDNVDLDEELFNPNQTWVKRTDMMITNYELNRDVGAWGNSMIMTLEDGSFIVFDGGHVGQTGSSNDHDYLYRVLCDLHEKVYGTAPSVSNPIRISAWLISHEHSDHFGVFRQFCHKYGKSAEVQVDRVMCNFISAEERYNTCNPETVIQMDIEGLKRDADNFDFIQVHTGETYYIANVEIRIMYTHEDAHPVRLSYFNNSTTVFNLGMHSTNAAINTASDYSKSENLEHLILLGDLERVGSRCLRSMYGETMEAEMVQVAHHGGNGVEAKLYELINAIVVWYPHSNSVVISNARVEYANSSNWMREANYVVCHGNERVKMIITGGDSNQNSKGYNFTLTLTVNGVDYENFYDAVGHKVVETDPEIPTDKGDHGYVILRENK